jgi:hypothetical protein
MNYSLNLISYKCFNVIYSKNVANILMEVIREKLYNVDLFLKRLLKFDFPCVLKDILNVKCMSVSVLNPSGSGLLNVRLSPIIDSRTKTRAEEIMPKNVNQHTRETLICPCLQQHYLK